MHMQWFITHFNRLVFNKRKRDKGCNIYNLGGINLKICSIIHMYAALLIVVTKQSKKRGKSWDIRGTIHKMDEGEND